MSPWPSVATWAWRERQPPIYASTATILVEQAERKVVKIDDVETKNLESLEYLNTVIQSLGTQLLMERVITTLKLDQDPDFTPPKPDGSAYTVSEIAASLGKKVNAKLRRLTRLIDITVEDTDPKRAQLIAEALVTEFLKQGYEQNAKLSRAANEFLFQEADKLKARLEASEEKLQRYRKITKPYRLKSGRTSSLTSSKRSTRKSTKRKPSGSASSPTSNKSSSSIPVTPRS